MINGIDVSAYQGKIQWDKVGKQFAYVKMDSNACDNVRECANAGMLVGGYGRTN